MTLKFLDLYNDITSQAWSMFDSEVESKEDFEASVTTSIQKALSKLWFSFDFEFKKRTQNLKTRQSKVSYELPNGQINKVDGNYDVKYNKTFLDFVQNTDDLEEKQGEPEKFYIENNKFCLYPTPDNTYTVKIGYLSMMPACNEDGEEKANLSEAKDYINISERYEDVFRNTLLPLAMVYLIASESDENYSAYMWQYQNALNILKKQALSLKKERVIGW